MKVYTKTGDKGQTSLIGGERVSKSHARLEAYGTIDELNSFVGLLVEYLEDSHDKEVLSQIQSLLFSVGGYLATPENKKQETIGISNKSIVMLEKEIDQISERLPPLKSFVLPGGCKSAALANVCRTITRRAERCIYCIPDISGIDSDSVVFVNRLSDYFFVLARKECFLCKKEEKIWRNPCE